MGAPSETETQIPRPIEAPTSSPASINIKHADAPPSMPPPPYFKTHFVNPSSFKAGINRKLDDPFVSLFRLAVPVLQTIFALAAGIPYAIELSHGNGRGDASASFVFSQVTFGTTFVVLVANTITVRYYRISWFVDWVLAIFWFALFAVFYQVYLGGEMESAFTGVNIGRMKGAIWCDLINALLWLVSAMFSSTMCCSGVKASIKGKLKNRRQRKEKKKMMGEIGDMESGIIQR